ncbi:SDR family NAD(P)-dependent oxidoreductase [Aestuariimicrobium ganziense]|uniref:SDR family NAD(P)-dependent oxidoreductase n=1 Tax=Aestuariimicrobium ganziense TaxID=2773677 RepID=UPI00194067A9|nr:SDR family oxidoreductase [Aestuariimicrobium ganziense]
MDRPPRIVVTGSASGLGAAIALGLEARGLDVVGLDRTNAGPAQRQVVDVTDPDAVAAAFETIGDPLDGIVVSAGVQMHGDDGPVAEVSLETWQRTIDVNLTGAWLCLKAAVPHLLTRETSSVVLIGSPTAVTMCGAGYAAYAASKAGMMALARVMAADHAAEGLRANVVVPGTMRTPLIEPLLADETTRANLLAGTPVGRLGEPDDLVGLVAWLLSSESRFATGASYAVDGGLTAR